MAMNKNMLSPVGFSFHIKKLPEFNFFVQNVTLPGVNFPVIEQPTPFKTVPRYGDHLVYGELTVTFKVNEDLGNYIELYNWLVGLSFPDNFDQYKALADEGKQLTGDGLESDSYLMIMSSNMQPVIRVDFEDIFPVSLSDLTMDSRDSNVDYIEATANFRFLRYTFTPL